MTNLTDEGLNELAKKSIWNWVCGNWCPECSEKRTGKVVKEELVQQIAVALQQVRDTAKKEMKEKAAEDNWRFDWHSFFIGCAVLGIIRWLTEHKPYLF